ncbi:2-hydroxychromene-2-carboxylate isomerase, putative [Trichophyton benhamiae CBS 112371]|uniref:Glutathione S-transferase kappa n=1 Tax=Arthroderma benhamiae (strain ATCC MYA-4681 / CBS 112371) TaxID=663331 RepID=D4ANR4_ARTBC|nr:2-hydroxychromene-2-carboxylate isomerase, putative [Trichophyton benhamiae CBS 112371]EFE34925.1 2-hydroxychromene-2-carboxylate isomerase, putative [Trichophyton benhamiae CBS 112371]
MAAPKITLYVDIVSPFAYIAYHVLRNSPVFAKCTTTYVPVLLGGIIQATGNTPPIRIKSKPLTRPPLALLNLLLQARLISYILNPADKDKWINVERLRWSKLLGVPITEAMPDGFPVFTLAVQRALCVVAADHPEKLAGCIDALYNTLWVKRDSSVIKPEGYVPVLETVIGKDAAIKVAEKANTAEIKQKLVSNTDRSVESGAFGLPWMECTNSKGETESFFGVDHLGQVVAFLGLDGTLGQGFKALL